MLNTNTVDRAANEQSEFTGDDVQIASTDIGQPSGLVENTNRASSGILIEALCAVGFSPSGQSNEPIKLDISAEKMAETVVTHAYNKHRNRTCGLRLEDREIVSKASTEDWPQYTVAAGHVLGKLDLDLPNTAQFREGGRGFRRAAVGNIRQELVGQTVEVRATREDRQPPRGREYRRVKLRFVPAPAQGGE